MITENITYQRIILLMFSLFFILLNFKNNSIVKMILYGLNISFLINSITTNILYNSNIKHIVFFILLDIFVLVSTFYYINTVNINNINTIIHYLFGILFLIVAVNVKKNTEPYYKLLN